jgi:hypothetical protein
MFGKKQQTANIGLAKAGLMCYFVVDFLRKSFLAPAGLPVGSQWAIFSTPQAP